MKDLRDIKGMCLRTCRKGLGARWDKGRLDCEMWKVFTDLCLGGEINKRNGDMEGERRTYRLSERTVNDQGMIIAFHGVLLVRGMPLKCLSMCADSLLPYSHYVHPVTPKAASPTSPSSDSPNPFRSLPTSTPNPLKSFEMPLSR